VEAQDRRAVFVTIANFVASSLLAVVFYCTLAVAGIAAGIVLWPLYTLLLVSIALSVAGLGFTKAAGSRASRFIGFTVNGGALGFGLLIVAGLAVLFFGATRERFLMRDGYKGDVYVMYGVPRGEYSERTHWEVTYRIPDDGVLAIREEPPSGWTRPEYEYEMKGGKLKPITNLWVSTIHPTRENLANDADIGVFFPRTGRFTNSTGCSVNFLQFYVGTKAHLLRQYKPLDIADFLDQHPQYCAVPKQ
jgi:hypothetical protein